MSILIEGIDIPKKGFCKVLTIYADGIADGIVYDHTTADIKEFRAVNIPAPHGKLIDVQDIDLSSPSFGTDEWLWDLVRKHNFTYEQDVEEHEAFDFGMSIIKGFENVVKSAPTIIEAEE